nr:RecName: Full=Acetyl-CoA acetyltransferase; AltName: Full=Acetoacetyl-CoA thiolase [Sus scrofa]
QAVLGAGLPCNTTTSPIIKVCASGMK